MLLHCKHTACKLVPEQLFWEGYVPLLGLLGLERLLSVLLMGLHSRHDDWRWAEESVDDLVATEGELIVAQRWVCQKSFGSLNVLQPAWGVCV